jgi:hypothetical protein
MTKKIFQIGFNRCGTTSLYNFFKKQCKDNLKCVHWDNGKIGETIYRNKQNHKLLLFNSKYTSYNFISDMECRIDNKYYFTQIHDYQLLEQQYPKARFILNTRSFDNWIKSRLKHYNNKDIELQLKTYSYNNIIKLWTDQWEQHHYNVQKYFQNKLHKLLIFDIETTDASPIINFFHDLKFNTSIFYKHDYK